jgi:alpha-methylacyl-CoA racemase
MILADLGADVVRIERPDSGTGQDTYGSVLRGRKRLELDLKTESDREKFLSLAESADVLVEGMRPGVMERLGLGPEQVFGRNSKIIFARMTGWGQDGPLANQAGHDINYIAITGILDAIGSKEKPSIPLNIIGDFAGGGCFLLIGILSALTAARDTRERVVLDTAMVDGASVLMSLIYSRYGMRQWTVNRESNPLDGGVPWYDTYKTKDGKRVAVGALEPKFYDNLIENLGVKGVMPSRDDEQNWPVIRQILTDAFLKKTRDEWVVVFVDTDACVSPVLNLSEAPFHPHLKERGTLLDDNGKIVPAPAPIFNGNRSSISPEAMSGSFSDIDAQWRR